MPKYLNLLTDFAFKKIFADPKNKHILIDLLNTFLKEEQLITDLTFMNSEQLGRTRSERRVIFDLYCTNQLGDHIIIEMQRASQTHFLDRSLYYASQVIRNQGKKKQWDYELNSVYTIALLNFIINGWNSPKDKFYYKLGYRDEEMPQLYFKKSINIYVELPKFKKSEHELASHLDKWMYILIQSEKLNQKPTLITEPIFMDLLEKAELLNLSEKERATYEYELKVYRDNYSTMKHAKTVGRNIGYEEAKIEMILDGFAMGLSIQLLAKQSKLSEEEVIRIIEANK